MNSPAVENIALDNKFKNKMIRSAFTVRNMPKVGDLYSYLNRFDIAKGESNELYNQLTSLGLDTYESIKHEFASEFAPFLNDVTTLTSFVEGTTYSAWDISICARTYELQSGMYLLGENNTVIAVLIKATLDGGVYANEWLAVGTEIKYYFYSRKGNYSTKSGDFKYNKAIIENKNLPIALFIKEFPNKYKYEGIFKYADHRQEGDGKKYFILKKDKTLAGAVSLETYQTALMEKVVSSLSDDLGRRRRLKDRVTGLPEKIQVLSFQYKRDPDVIADVLIRANGICENCKKPAPFLRKKDKSAYLEVHHIIQLSMGGEDTINNAIAVCPNCHRRLHFG
ncbi:HNH endonuclease [Leptospira interrogans]|uniref:HNH endonuclease n=1 Tax=Leptospira interrogans TaxID=173 RepID=UPI002014AFC7|nr:HNH endonuclease [Leptospira interrogans]